jgi:hypothetical protein
MTIQIEIKDDHVKDLLEFYSSKQRALKDQISKLERDLRDINSTISQLKHLTAMPGSPSIDLFDDAEIFSPKWPWIKKIAFAIKEAGKPISTKEIVEVLNVYEQRNEEDKKSAISSVSSTLSIKSGKYSDKREFVKAISSTGEYIYDVWKEKKDLDDHTINHFNNIVIGDLPF